MSIKKVQDINISDNSLKNEFSNKYNNNQYSAAYEILDNNDQLNTKKFIAEVVNFISETLSTLQQNYYENTVDYFDNLNDQFQLVIDNYKYIGEYDSSQLYRIYNIVFDSGKYYMYINQTPSSNIPLNNILYWVEFDIKGQKGADGIGVNFIGNWDNTTTYENLDGVYYNGAMWCCKSSNINQVPQDGSLYWESIFKFLKAEIISSDTEPIEKYNGLIWMEILS